MIMLVTCFEIVDLKEQLQNYTTHLKTGESCLCSKSNT